MRWRVTLLAIASVAAVWAAPAASARTKVVVAGGPPPGNSGLAGTVRFARDLDLNGFYQIQDTIQVRDGKETFATHGVFTYDRDDRHYKLFWHDSLGYYSPAPASGGWTGNTLILVRGSLRGNARHVYEVVDNDNYSMKIQFSPDSEGWADVLTGTYRRIH